jgi:hypothetical protein
VSVTIYGRHDGDVIFEDENGWASIPVRRVGRPVLRP